MSTPIELGPAAEHAAQILARRIRARVPESLIADPLAFAREYWRDATSGTDGGHWRYIEPPAPVTTARGRWDPPNDEWRAAKAALKHEQP